MSASHSADFLRNWNQVLAEETSYLAARKSFAETINHAIQGGDQDDVVSFFREQLHDPGPRRTALRSLYSLSDSLKKLLFSELVDLCSVGHVDIVLAREVILSMDRKWVNEHILAEILKILSTTTEDAYEEFQRLLELVVMLESPHVSQIVRLAQNSEDEEVREIGDKNWEDAIPSQLRVHAFFEVNF